jgi:hypothetical protein
MKTTTVQKWQSPSQNLFPVLLLGPKNPPGAVQQIQSNLQVQNGFEHGYQLFIKQLELSQYSHLKLKIFYLMIFSLITLT